MSLEGPVQFATTKDGVSIAYRHYGPGPALVHPPASVVDTMAVAAEVGFVSASPVHSIVRFDRRGSGLSDRDVMGFSMEDAIADLDAVVDALDAGPVALVGTALYAPAVLRYAATHGSKVSHLLLNVAFPSHRILLETGAVRAMRAALEIDFDFWLYAMASWALRGTRPVAGLVEVLRSELDQDTLLAAFADLETHDATDDLSDIDLPTLVVLRSAFQRGFPDQRSLAARIPGAALVTDDATGPYGMSEDAAAKVAQFLGVAGAMSLDGGSQTIMFTDLVSSTALTQALGDRAAQQIVDTHDLIVRAALDNFQGREVKHTGDGIMATFRLAANALHAARRIQRDLKTSEVQARIGLNAGEPIEQDGDLFGTAVQLAARVCDHAPAGAIHATEVVKELTSGHNFEWTPQDSYTPKGFNHEVALYALDPQ